MHGLKHIDVKSKQLETRLAEKSVCAVVVTYFPDVDRFKKVLTQVCKQCSVLIIDNGSAHQSESLQQLSAENGCFMIFNDSNVGIAAAQNKITAVKHPLN